MKSKYYTSNIRQRMIRLADRRQTAEQVLLSRKELLKGTVVEVARTCGKPGCKCGYGEKHQCYQISASIQGKTKTWHVPRNLLYRVRRWTRNYREFRKARAAWVKINSQILKMINELEQAKRRDSF